MKATEPDGTAPPALRLFIHTGQHPNQPLGMAASQAECSRAAVMGPAVAACSGRRHKPVAQLRPAGVQRAIRARGRPTHPPSWLAVVGRGSCHCRARCRDQLQSTKGPSDRVAGFLTRSRPLSGCPHGTTDARPSGLRPARSSGHRRTARIKACQQLRHLSSSSLAAGKPTPCQDVLCDEGNHAETACRRRIHQTRNTSAKPGRIR